MVYWDGVMTYKLISINIGVEFLLRYVDDVTFVLRVKELKLT